MTCFFKTGRKLVCCALLAGVVQAADAQSTISPFDLIPRAAANAPADSTVAIATSSNPFDIVKVQPSWRRSAAPQGFQVVRQAKPPLSVRDKEAIYRRFLFVSVLVMLIILTLIVTIFRILIVKIWEAFFNDNLLNQLLREQGAGITLAYLILYVMFFLNAGLFLFLSCRHFGVALAGYNAGSLLLCAGGVAGFLLLKHALLGIVGFIFPVQKEVAAYTFTITVFNIVLGFALVPANLLAAYAPKDLTPWVIYGTAGLLGAAYLFRSLRGLFIARRFLAGHKFHFLLYFCAVEIAPLLILAKLLFKQAGA